MKKTLLAVAVAAALPAAAFAQSNVTLYGIADAGVGFVDTDGPGADASMVVNSGYQSTSRFGIRGSEDLGGGLKATFNIEAGVKWDTGEADDGPGNALSSNGTSPKSGSGFFQRRSVVGLAGGFGEVRLGRDYTPGFSAAGTTDVMGYGLYGNWLTYTAQGGIATRASNGIHYTGSFSGVTVRAMYATGETNDAAAGPMAGDKDLDDMWGLSAVYAGGPLTVQGYFQEVNFGANNTAASLGVAGATLTGGASVRQMGVGAGYNFGAFRVTAQYGIADADSQFENETGVEKLQGYGVGVGVKIGTGELLAQAMQLKANLAVAGTDPKATVFGLAYVHPLSKRTNLYATYGMARNNSAGNFAVLASDNRVPAGELGADPQGIAIGIRHLF